MEKILILVVCLNLAKRGFFSFFLIFNNYTYHDITHNHTNIAQIHQLLEICKYHISYKIDFLQNYASTILIQLTLQIKLHEIT